MLLISRRKGEGLVFDRLIVLRVTSVEAERVGLVISNRESKELTALFETHAVTSAKGAKLYIGRGIAFQVIKIEEDRVFLGIDTPPGVSVDRVEIYLKIYPGDLDGLLST